MLSAANGQEALDRIRQHLPDLILLDLDMPDHERVSRSAQQLKADPATANIPVLMLTAWAEPEQRVRGLQLGAEDYLAKPFDYRELLARIEARLRAKQDTDEMRAAQKTIRETFERYVSPQVVERLLADPTTGAPGGRAAELDHPVCRPARLHPRGRGPVARAVGGRAQRLPVRGGPGSAGLRGHHQPLRRRPGHGHL